MEPSKALVRQSNQLIEASYSLPVPAKRFMTYLISLLGAGDGHSKWYDVDLDALSETFATGHKSVMDQFDGVVELLMKSVIKIRSSKAGDYKMFQWLDGKNVSESRKILRVSIHPELREYLLELKEFYTTYAIANIANLRSFYAIRLYELLKQYQHYRRRTFDPETLRFMLGADEGYRRYSNFKQRVILPAVKEISRSTDITVKFEDFKEGKVVTKLVFSIFPNERALAEGKAAALAAAGNADGVRAILTERFEFRDAEADAIVEGYSESHIRENAAIVEKKMREAGEMGKPITNPTAYLRAAIKKDWRPKPGTAAADAEEAAKNRRKLAAEKAAKETLELDGIKAAREAAAAAWAGYEALPDDRKAALRDEFEADLEAGRVPGGEFILNHYRASGLSTAVAKSPFRLWLTKRGEAQTPSDSNK